jgi:hypothetical protein
VRDPEVPRLEIRLQVSTSNSIRAAAKAVADALEDGRLGHEGDTFRRYRDGVTYAMERFADRIEVREAEAVMVLGGARDD